MTILTARDVKGALESIEDFYWGEPDWGLGNSLEIDGRVYPVEVVAEEHGGEGSWDAETFVVLRVGDQLFRKTGHYRSHYGDDWDGPLVEVEPFIKTIPDFREVKR